MKEQIVEMSGLSPRVIRVWFQNKRCKDKKNQIKQELQQEKVSRKNTTEIRLLPIPFLKKLLPKISKLYTIKKYSVRV